MNKSLLIFKDELVGFAKSGVMIALWLLFPLVGLLLYFLVGDEMMVLDENTKFQVPMFSYIATVVTNMVSTLAAILITVAIINERNGKVFDLYVIRPIKAGQILFSKFAAVTLCVGIALALSLFLGVIVDMVRGSGTASAPSIGLVWDTFHPNFMLIAVSTALGVIIGVISPTILVAVLIIVFGAGFVTLIPMIPAMTGLSHIAWITNLISLGLVVLMMWGSIAIFNKKEF